MDRGKSIQNANAIWLYLVTFYPKALIELESTIHSVRIHFADYDMAEEEIYQLAAKLDHLRLVGTEKTINENEKGGFYTIDIDWPFWKF